MDEILEIMKMDNTRKTEMKQNFHWTLELLAVMMIMSTKVSVCWACLDHHHHRIHS